jgi:hypothetical protein
MLLFGATLLASCEGDNATHNKEQFLMSKIFDYNNNLIAVYDYNDNKQLL